MADLASKDIRDPFTQSWIQALTLAADHPIARTIKPTFDLVDRVSKELPGVDRLAAARDLWEFAEKQRLAEMLWLLPSLQSEWVFDRDDIFAYTRPDNASLESGAAAIATGEIAGGQDGWLSAIGVTPLKVPLVAEVTSGDWAGLVRKEAVRLQQSLSLATNQGSTLHLPCVGVWDLTRWQIQFQQVDWVRVLYEEVPSVGRLTPAELEERVLMQLSDADEHLRINAGVSSTHPEPNQPWLRSAAKLSTLHESVLRQSSSFSPWLIRTWLCAWPIIYREQNVLQGKADIGVVRQELKACLNAQPRLTLWMLVLAKLTCQAAIGRGLGFCADFGD